MLRTIRKGPIIKLAILSLIAPFGWPVLNASAISDCDKKAVLYQTVYYDECISDIDGGLPPGLPPGDGSVKNAALAKELGRDRGWDKSPQFDCLYELWRRESSWSEFAINDAEGNNDLNGNHRLDQGESISETEWDAYGIPQSLPGGKMAAAGHDWRHNPETQIKWGLGYIAGRYQNPCNALKWHDEHNWY